MSERYDPKAIEPKWQAYWESNRTFATDPSPDKPKAYILDMFPYPSGAGLHVGHPEGYTATDIITRKLRSQGFAVLHPMGWDAFGLPAEQYAIQTGTHPSVTTERNIDNFRRQIKSLGLSYDWDREVDTTRAEYLRWTQWIFLRLFARGLAYQAEAPVNWCPALGTVLANEEVKDGVSERGGHPVVRVPLRQWMLRITAYADRLLNDLTDVDWPEGTRRMQQEWIGRSEGARVFFPIEGHSQALEIFTTRPDTLFGATFMVLAPEHPLLEQIAGDTERAQVIAYRQEVARKSDLERKSSTGKSGAFTGAYALHPLTQQRLPIWTADYVLSGYGTGAIMAVPAHDQRDFDFARMHHLPITRVVGSAESANDELEQAYCEDGVAVNSGPYNGLSTAAFKTKIIEDLQTQGLGERQVNYKLRDWIFSRQRYWGEPIPIYFPVETSGDPRRGDPHVVRYDQPIAVDAAELPLMLPKLDDFRPSDDPLGPLARAVDWRFFEKDGRFYARETNTMPQWAGSCWYYLRFMDPHNTQEPWSKEAAQRWLPVDLYVGGAEHAVLHLLYARFWHKVLFDEGLVQTPEPFTKLVHQGTILGEMEFTAYVDTTGKYVSADEVSQLKHKVTSDPVTTRSVAIDDVEKQAGDFVLKAEPNIVVDAKAHKMSKSRGNVVNPDDVVEQFGADAMRLYEMFLGPLEATKPWSTRSIVGVRRFLERVYHLCQTQLGDSDAEQLKAAHRAIDQVTRDIDGLRMNTAISTLMVLSNQLQNATPPSRQAVEVLVQLLSPFAPHIAEEAWEMLGHAPSIQSVPWPKANPALLQDAEVEVPVQINGKVKGRVKVARGADQATVLAAAQTEPKVAETLANQTLVKTIWVPDKILTLVVKPK